MSRITRLTKSNANICHFEFRPIASVNVKMKMYKNADSKCTIVAKYSQIGYNLSGSDENELQKRHLREGEIYA